MAEGQSPQLAAMKDKTVQRTFWSSNKDADVSDIKAAFEREEALSKQNVMGATPLHLCSQFISNASVVRMFLDTNGSQVNDRTHTGWTPLMYAAGNVTGAGPEVINRLVEAGADLDLQDKDGWCALTVAVYNKRSDNVKALLDHGASKNIQDKNGLTPLDHAGKKSMAVRNKTGATAAELTEIGELVFALQSYTPQKPPPRSVMEIKARGSTGSPAARTATPKEEVSAGHMSHLDLDGVSIASDKPDLSNYLEGGVDALRSRVDRLERQIEYLSNAEKARSGNMAGVTVMQMMLLIVIILTLSAAHAHVMHSAGDWGSIRVHIDEAVKYIDKTTDWASERMLHIRDGMSAKLDSLTGGGLAEWSAAARAHAHGVTDAVGDSVARALDVIDEHTAPLVEWLTEKYKGTSA